MGGCCCKQEEGEGNLHAPLIDVSALGRSDKSAGSGTLAAGFLAAARGGSRAAGSGHLGGRVNSMSELEIRDAWSVEREALPEYRDAAATICIAPRWLAHTRLMMELFPVVSPHRNRHSGSSNHGKLLIFQGNVRNLLIQVNYWHRTNK